MDKFVELSEDKLQEIRDACEEVKQTKSGLSRAELQHVLIEFGYNFTAEDLAYVMRFFDLNRDGYLYVDEIIKNMPKIATHYKFGSQMRKSFEAIDANNDGFIRMDEFRAVLMAGKNGMSGEEASKVLTQLLPFDTNGDGKFDYSEFMHIYLSGKFKWTNNVKKPAKK